MAKIFLSVGNNIDNLTKKKTKKKRCSTMVTKKVCCNGLQASSL